ncbi:MAG: Ig-like domain-containing protein [Candidatus Marinimicrobia bacterium]|nr:Ig-like domain-containing protein [Candidatus Neomarinimicrobiota bacterium]
MTFPQDGATCNEIVTLGIDASDPDGICGVEININDLKIDIPLSEILGNINNEPVKISLNTNELPDGPVSLSVSICDCDDNCTESPPVDYTIDNTLSIPDTIKIESVVFNNAGFDISWEESNATDFNQYDLYHSTVANESDYSLIFSTNDVKSITYFLENVDPLILNYFYITVSDSFNYSSKSSVFISSLDPKPLPINITSIIYDEESMQIFWNESPDSDFLKYELYSGINDTLNNTLINSVFIKSVSSFSIDDFDPHVSNYFRIIVYDTLNQSTKGSYMSNTVRPIPQSVSLDSIDSFGNELTIKWSGYQSSDFKSYKLYRSLNASMSDKVAIYTSYSSQDTSYFSIENDYETAYYFVVSIIDDWGYEVFSNMQSATPKYFTFLQSYGSDNESIGGFYGIQTTTEEYRIIAKDNSDIVLKSVNRYGILTSSTSYNYSQDETPVKIIETQDNDGYVFVSTIVNNNQDTDIRITKTMQDGTLLWNSIIGYDSEAENLTYGLDEVNDMILSSENEYIIVGQYHAQHPDILILEINQLGNIDNQYNISIAPQSQRTIENGKSIIEVDNGYVILASLAESSSSAPSNILLLKFDTNISSNGDTLWTKNWNLDIYDYPKRLIHSTDGSYTFCGYSSDNNNQESGNSWIINTNINGEQNFLTSISGNNFALDMIENHMGNYIIVGKNINNNNYQGWLACYDAQGNQLWEKLYGNESIDVFKSINQTKDNGYIVTGETNLNGISKILHLKTDPNGDIQ